MVVQTWDCIITRKVQIKRTEMRFQDYTDWISDSSGRLDFSQLGNFILAANNNVISMADGNLLEWIKNE